MCGDTFACDSVSSSICEFVDDTPNCQCGTAMSECTNATQPVCNTMGDDNNDNDVCACSVNGEKGNGTDQGTCDEHQYCNSDGTCTTCTTATGDGSTNPHLGCNSQNPTCGPSGICMCGKSVCAGEQPVCNTMETIESCDDECFCTVHPNTTILAIGDGSSAGSCNESLPMEQLRRCLENGVCQGMIYNLLNKLYIFDE